MSKSNFEAALAFVLRFEGGYADHPADPGGATNMGITRTALAAWRGQPVSKAEVRALTRAEAGQIYRARYWNAVRGDDLPAGLDLAVFDCAVNSGPSRAVRLLQRALRVAEDGRLGPATLASLVTMPPDEVISRLCALRGAFLRGLPTYPVFGRGWSARLNALEREAKRLARKTPLSPSVQTKEPAMDATKSILTSRTLWANTIGLLALGLSALGFNTATLDTSAITDSLFQLVAAGSFIISSVFRVIATKRLG
ncbi:MAG: glycoside hydrolase family 108 protein [Proteobacteria bacterium]|nr:glycoside hydrolase family 108 protein [Pseudomonadota bacterium]